MKAVRLEQVGRVELVDLDDPEPGPGEVLIRVDAAGMCGTDRHLLSGEHPSRPPVILGHEFEGQVAATGEGTSVAVGTRAAVDPNITCGQCRFCRLGLVSHCTRLSAIGVQRDGGFAHYVRVPERQVYPLPADLPPGLGALCEPLSCCLRAMDHAMIQPGNSVAVIGGGVIGQLLVQLARLAGATEVVLVTRQKARRELAETLGATASLDPGAAPVSTSLAGPRGLVPGGVDVAFEAAGAAGTLVDAVHVVRAAGAVIVVGAAPQQMTSELRPFEIFARELRIQGSYLNPLTQGRAAALLASGSLRLEPLITRSVALSELVHALASPPLAGEVKTIAIPGLN